MDVKVKTLADGIKIPTLGIGTWLLQGQKCIDVVKKALEIGYRHIDTAYIYENHEAVKEGMRGFERKNIFITTKLWYEHLDPEKVDHFCDISLKQLGVDYVDLFLIHWPKKGMPICKTLEKMFNLKDKGKIKSVGVSNFTIHHLQDILKEGYRPSLNQVEFHPYLNQKDLLSFCSKNGIAIGAYSPIARGEVFEDTLLQSMGEKHSKTAGQITLRWLLQKGLIVTPKASSEEHLKENFNLFDFELEEIDMNILENISERHPKRIIAPEFSEFDY